MIRVLTLFACSVLLGAAAPAPDSVAIPVTVAPSLGGPQSGRIIVFVKRLEDPAKPDASVDFSTYAPDAVSIAAREVIDMRPGGVAIVDGEADAFPAPFSTFAPGVYEVQAVLDRNHDYNYTGRGEGDLVSRVTTVSLPGPMPVVTLDTAVPTRDLEASRTGFPVTLQQQLKDYLPKVIPFEFQSKAVTAFRGAPACMRGWIALPPGYDGKRRFPTGYYANGFGSTVESQKEAAAVRMADMATGRLAPMIWVMLDFSGPMGTHEFADSVNNGPWGKALTEELIPELERRYRMDAKPSGRFVTGHSSGGWAALWLQTRYPKVFGGAWPTAPDPADFRDFLTVDIYARDANFYRTADGAAFPLIRSKGKVLATQEQFAKAEAVLGATGGQNASFEAVFSPRGADGKPVPLFDRATGRIDPAVAAYWRENYDVSYILKRDWARLRPDLDGKIHLIVGSADTFYLDRAAHRLESVMKALGAKTDFRFIPGKGHFDLYQRGEERGALNKDISWEMYAVARPESKRPAG